MLPDPDRRRRILDLSLPIIGGMVSQNILNLVDTAMVGRLGDAALAAVGLGGFANFMCIAFITGMSAGVQAMAARRLGEGRTGETAVPLNGGLLLVALIAVPASVALFLLAPRLFPLLDDTPQVIALGTDYLRARLVAMVAVGSNFAFRGYWNATNRSRLYLRTLLVMHASNIALNYLLIFGHLGFPALGVLGAGIGTAASTFLGTAYYFVLGLRHARTGGFLRGLPDRRTLATMLRLCVPAGLQQFFFATGMTLFFAIVARVGTAELAASTVLINLLLVAMLPGLGFGLGAASLVGQALGRGDPEDAARWGREVSALAMAVVAAIALPALLLPELCLAPFITDPDTRALAAGPLRLLAVSLPLDCVSMVLLNALLGAGDSRRVMAISVGMQWLVQLPAVAVVALVLDGDLLAIWSVQIAARLAQSAVFALNWRARGWARVHV